MATIKFIKHHMRNPDTKTSLIEGSKDVFKDFTYVDYKNISKDDINYLPLHIRQPFDIEDLLIKQIPNDMYLCLLNTSPSPRDS